MRTSIPAICLIIVAFITACGDPAGDPARQLAVLPPEPPLAQLDIPVREQFETVRSRVADMLAIESNDDALGDAFGDLGMLYHAYSYWEPALFCYQQAIRLDPGDVRWAYYTGLIARRLGDYALSASSFESALRLNPDDLYSRTQLAINHLESAELDKAIAGFETVLLDDPDNVSALTGRGRAALEQADWAIAAIYLEAASENSQSTEVLQGLGLAYRGLGHDVDARQLFRQASISAIAPDVEFSDDPRLQAVIALRRGSEAHDRRAMLALTLGQMDRAEQEYVLALEANPDKVDVRHNYGLLLWRQGNRDAATEQFNTILEARPDYLPTLLTLGFELTVAGDFDTAESHIRAAVTADEDNLEAQLMLADFLDHTGRNEEALVHYNKGIALDSQNLKGYIGAALSLARLGKHDDALVVIANGLQNLPGDQTLLQLETQISAVPP